jgi:hypothetical protein
LVGQRPGRAGQPGAFGTRAPAYRHGAPNPVARSRRGAGAARQHRCLDAARPQKIPRSDAQGTGRRAEGAQSRVLSPDLRHVKLLALTVA